MTVILKKGESKAEIQMKLNNLQKSYSNRKQKSFTALCGSLKGIFKEDAVVLQRKLRDEWQ